jgi:metal-responsive CopG/Arc/MetJ family transcriptional regulator
MSNVTTMSFTIPKDLLNKLKARLPSGNRSLVLSELIRMYLDGQIEVQKKF